MICESPKIAVCIVGQMRTLKRTKVAEQIYQIWKRVGTNCVDIYMDVGIEATNNKLKYSNISIHSAMKSINILQPKHYSITSSVKNFHISGCNDVGSKRICYKGVNNQCKETQCTHCIRNDVYSYNYRIKSCFQTALDTGLMYEWFVFQRPDMFLWNVPAYHTFQRFDKYSVYQCGKGLDLYGTSDFFNIIPSRFIRTFQKGLLPSLTGCISKKSFKKLHKCNTDETWAKPECSLRLFYSKNNITIKNTSSVIHERGCRILRERS